MLVPSRHQNLIVALVAQNENQALLGASAGLDRDWAERGYEQIVLNMLAPEAAPKLMSILKEGRVAFAYGYAGVGAQFSLADGGNLWTAARVPYAALWYDHPSYNYHQHIVDSPYVIHCYHILDHLEARQKHLPPSSSQSILLTRTDKIWQSLRVKPWAQRDHKILYAKTATPPDRWVEDWQRHPPALQKILWSLVEEAQKNRNLDLADTAQSLFRNEGLPTGNLDLFMGALQEADAYLRAWRSDRLARSLLAFPTHIIGRGWEYLDGLPRRAEFFPPLSITEYQKHAEDYRILANSNPFWRHGMHERAYLGIYMGAVVLTDRTEWSDSIFGDLPNYIGFEWHDHLEDTIAQAVRQADGDDADYFSAAERAINERIRAGRMDYVSQLEAAIETTRHYAASQIPKG